jgi:GNAT superfamily N-acetyltransferase
VTAVSFADKLVPTLRTVVQDDWAYIMDSFKKSYRELGEEQYIPAHLYWPEVTNRLENWRQDKGVEFRIAADPEDSNFIWGWSCVEGPVLHYVFVRKSAQGQGVARMLTADLPRPIACTHWTKIAEEVHRKHRGQLLYEPSRRKK